VTEGIDLTLVDSRERILDVAGRPGDTAGGLGLGYRDDDNFVPLTRPEVATVLAAGDGTLLFEAWAGTAGYVYAATPGRSEWISFDAGDPAASGPGASPAIHAGLLAGLAPPARVRCGHGWLTVSAVGALDAATATVLLERVAGLRNAVGTPRL
jgi:hypothetical protein